MLFRARERDPALMSAQMWKAVGAKPFKDEEFDAAVSGKAEGAEAVRV